MFAVRGDLRYTESHLWIRDEGDGVVSLGLTDYGQFQLGEIVFVELPAEGSRLACGGVVAVVESIKTATELHSPVTGVVEAINGHAVSGPERINRLPYESWIVRVRLTAPPAPLTSMLDANAYRDLLPAEEG